MLFTLDRQGDLASTNEHGGGPAPLVYVFRGAGFAAACFRAGASPALRDAVSAVVGGGGGLGGDVDSPSPLGPAVLTLAGDFAEDTVLYNGPVFRFPAPVMAPMGAMLFYPGNAPLLHPDLGTLGPELRYRRPAYAVMRDGRAVCVCYTSRASAIAAEAGVETAEAYRGHGCAQLAVDAWASAIRAKGLAPYYSTSWANVASLAVARKLELVAVGEDIHVSARALATRTA